MKKKLTTLILCLFLLNGTVFLSSCNETIIDHSIMVKSSNINRGTTRGFGTYKTGENVTIVALANVESTFVGWVKNNTLVSIESTYTFTANALTEGTYVAVFNALIEPAEYFVPSHFDVVYKHRYGDIEGIDFRLTSLNLALTLQNTQATKIIYENNQLNNEIFYVEDEDPFSIDFSSNYVIKNDQIHNFRLSFKYILNHQQNQPTKTITRTMQVNFSNLTIHEGEEKYYEVLFQIPSTTPLPLPSDEIVLSLTLKFSQLGT